jgi:hypothetical protein
VALVERKTSMKADEILKAASDRLSVITESCREGKVLEGMLNAAKNKAPSKRASDLLLKAEERLREIVPFCIEGSILVAMVEAGESAVHFDPCPTRFETRVAPDEKKAFECRFPFPGRAVSFSVLPEDAQAFEVLGITIGLISVLVGTAPASELSGKIPFALLRPEEGITIFPMTPILFHVENRSKNAATFSVVIRTRLIDT